MHHAQCPMTKGSTAMRGRSPSLVRVLRFAVVHGALCIFALATSTDAGQAVPLADVLQRMFGYVEQFQREFGSMVAEEQYDQALRQISGFARGDTRRVLRSDFLLVNVPGQGWTPFRDVFEADGRQVRDRQDRLTALFLSGTTAS